MRHLVLTLFALLIFASSTFAQEILWQEIETRDGTDLEFGVMRPADFDAKALYPVAVALPPGEQDKAMVEAGFGRYWGKELVDAGWVVVSPVAPAGKTFFSGAESLLPELLVHLRRTYRIESSRFHLIGASNGGRSAFRLATMRPFEFASMTAAPGFPGPDDAAKLSGLHRLKIAMYVGGDDKQWRNAMEDVKSKFDDLKISCSFDVFDGEGHVPPSLDGAKIRDLLESFRAAARFSFTGDAAAVSTRLDEFHDGAAKADGQRYFGYFAPDGVFLGTDGTERWTVEEFKKWSAPYFERKSAWIFVPQRRAVDVHGDVAWFDETVTSAAYGDCRGSGVLRKIGDEWLISQYNLTFVVPNDIADGAVSLIKAFEAKKDLAPSIVWICRHAEKADDGTNDPPLSEIGKTQAEALANLLGSIDLKAIYVSTFKRTQLTGLPLARKRQLASRSVDPSKTDLLAKMIRESHVGQQVLVIGHSNTVPALIEALGVKEKVTMEEGDYGDLFAVVRDIAGGVRLVRMRFGAAVK